MRLLLDTHAVLWWLQGRPERFGQRSRDRLTDQSTEVLVSTATIWEASIKRAQGRFPEAEGLLEALEGSEVELIPVMPRHANLAGALPRHHGDPFDRLLIAHAQIEGVPLVSNDRQLGAYAVEVVW